MNPTALLDEIKSLKKHGVNISSKNLILSDCASIIFSFHKNIDKISKDSQTIIIVGKNDKNTFPILSINYHEMLVKRDLKSDLFVIEGKHSSGSLINASKIIKKFID